jgi:ribose transport system substrate-binding protein
MALGAVTALESAGKTGEVLVVGYDNISAVQQLIREGKMLCTIDQHGDRFAALGISHALDMLEGKTQGGNKKTPVDLITAAELK